MRIRENGGETAVALSHEVVLCQKVIMNTSAKARLSYGITLVVCVGVVLLAMAWLSGVFRSGVIQPHSVAVATTPYAGESFPAKLVDRPVEVELVGSIESHLRTTVSSRLVASIMAVNVTSGDVVRKGDVLARLDDRDLKARVAQAEESLRSAEAIRDIAKREVARLEPLLAAEAASFNEVDQWRGKYQEGMADVARARQVIEELKVQLSDAVIAAPFDGVVIDRLAEPGDLAGPSKAIVTLYDPQHLRLDAVVREAYIGRLEQLRQEKTPLTVLIQATGRTTTGTIAQIVPAADQASRSFIAKVELQEIAGLYPGMFGRLRIPLESEERLEIPAAAIRLVGQVPLVDVVTEAGLQSRTVRVGTRHGEQVEILAGLSPDDRVALDR